MNIVKLSPEYFPNPSISRALGVADIYVGKPDLDPEVVANQKTLSVQQEDGTIVAVTQPISTGAGGVPLYEGSPVTLLVEGDYSLKVLDSSGDQIYYVPSTAYNQYLIAGNYYYPDYTEADQGVVGAGNSATDILAEVGAVEKATMYFSHNSGAETTTYTFTTNTSISDNFNIIIEEGVILDGAGILTLDNPDQITSGKRQQIFGSSITASFTNSGTVYPEWWEDNSTPGTTDMAAAVQAALNSIGSGGKVVITELTGVGSTGWTGIALSSVDDITIECVSNNAGFKVLAVPSQTITGFLPYPFAFKFATIDGLKLKGFTIDGNDKATCLVGLDTVTNSDIEYCFFTNNSEGSNLDGLFTIRCSGNNYVKNRASHCYNGLHIGHTATTDDEEKKSLIEGNYSHDNAQDGVVGHFTESQISLNRCFDNGASGIAFGTGYDNADAQLSISGNICKGNGYHGIQDDPTSGIQPKDVVISDNICAENTYSGIYLLRVQKGSVRGNVCRDNEYTGNESYSAGILIGGDTTTESEGCKNIVVSDNVCYDSRSGASRTQSYGIGILAQDGELVEDIKLSDNICKNNLYDGIKIQNSGTSSINGIDLNGNKTDDNAEYGLSIQEATAGDFTDFTLKNHVSRDNTTADFNIDSTVYKIINSRVETTGSPDIAYEEATVLDSSGGAITATLGSGLYIGQIKTISMQDASTSSTVSITNHETSDPEVATFDAVDEVGVFVWTGTEWATVKATCTFV